jgi:NAD(P)H-dependent FMN reductase
MKIQIVLGSTRPSRVGESVAKWALEIASQRTDLEFELVDVNDFNLPLLDEPVPPMMHQYSKDHTKRWSEKIDEADGFIFVTGEYNRSIPGAFKNAVDFLNWEWRNKALGFVAYGSAGGAFAVSHWRGVAAELHMADVRESLHLYLGSDFENYSTFKPTEAHAEQLNKVIDEVSAWSGALKTLR